MTKNFFWILLASATTLIAASCSSNTLSEPCEPNETKCEGSIFYKCKLSGDAWESTSCGNDTPICHVEHVCVACNADNDCPFKSDHCVDHVCEPLSVIGCTDNARQCRASKIYTCIDKAWENGVLCPQGCNVEGTNCLNPDDLCETDAVQCTKDGQLATCINAHWNISDCESNRVCPSDKTTCEGKVCNEDERICNADQNAKRHCINNAWVETACESGNSICLNGQCFPTELACFNGEMRCENNTVENCVNNAWKLKQTCSGTTPFCSDAQCVSTATKCTNGSTRCVTEGENKYQVCADNTWLSASTCPDQQVCSHDKCTECANGDTRCSGSNIERCEANIWDGIELCASDSPCDAQTGQCRTSAPQSTISTCKTLWLTYPFAYGCLTIPSPLGNDNPEVIGTLLCGKAKQTLKEYQKIDGEYNNNYDPKCGDASEFIGFLSDLEAGNYLCMWSYSLPGEKAAACTTNGTVVTNFDIIPTDANAFAYLAP